MSNFTPLVIQEYEFEGDKVSIQFSRLKRKDMIDAMPALKRMSDAKPDEGEDATVEQEEALSEAINDVLNSIVDVIPGYVSEFTGLNDTEGNPVPIETVCAEFYFMKLAIKIAVGVMEASAGKEGKV